jgi:hypothetical protein
MRFLLRSLILLLLTLWVGGFMFFPIVAASAFSVLPIHQAGAVVGKSLKTLQLEALGAGVLLFCLLIFAQRMRAFSRNLIAPIVLVVAMLGLTAFSQFSIIPRMDNDMVDAGGMIEAVPANNPYRQDFNRLHHESVNVFGAVLIGGILATIAVAWATAPAANSEPQP